MTQAKLQKQYFSYQNYSLEPEKRFNPKLLNEIKKQVVYPHVFYYINGKNNHKLNSVLGTDKCD